MKGRDIGQDNAERDLRWRDKMNVCLKDGESWVRSRYVYMPYLGKTLCQQ